MICLCTWRKKTVTHGGYSRGEFFSSNWNRKSRDNLSLLLLFVTTYYAEKSSLEKKLHYYVVYKNPHLMLNFLDVFSEICLNKFILSVDPQNTKIFTHQKRISEHLAMSLKYYLFRIDLASIWKYMPSFFLSIQTLYIKNKSVLLFFCKLFFKSIMFGHNDNFLKRTFVCALSEVEG